MSQILLSPKLHILKVPPGCMNSRQRTVTHKGSSATLALVWATYLLGSLETILSQRRSFEDNLSQIPFLTLVMNNASEHWRWISGAVN